MTLAGIDLSDREKLEMIRELDRFRGWASLDEKRYCLVCQNLITGRQIQVVKDETEKDRVHLICPTQHCHSIPMDWTIPTEQILAVMATRHAQ